MSARAVDRPVEEVNGLDEYKATVGAHAAVIHHFPTLIAQDLVMGHVG